MLEIHFQGTDVLRLFGVVSALLSICAFLPYLRDMWTGHTRPQRASWLIWSVLGSIALASQVYEGAMQSLWFATMQVVGTVTVLALSVRWGRGVFFSKLDLYVLAASGVGLVLWALTDTAVYALAITISISLMGGCVTALKAYRDPGSETLTMWFMSCIAAWFAILSVGGTDWVLLAYPIYLFVLNGVIVLAIMLGRAVQQAPAMPHAPQMFPAE
ncbi:hypothetical protein ACERZ8_09105 [Tateyamaria armeniaca]|uniref:Uncharacterized protein n=1 Tax=Tateyamaria armeniaca TaxID=2518930 RepID=A0ABW8USB5_9RHOB